MQAEAGKLKLGILSLQGGFERHKNYANKLGISPTLVQYPEQLFQIDALILPGGESTTTGKLLDRGNFLAPIRNLLKQGLPTLATCAGTILLSDEIIGSTQLRIGGLPLSIQRNAYGSQVESFETVLEICDEKQQFTSDVLFIRAPIIKKLNSSVQVLAKFNENPVAILHESIIACTFHFEYSDNPIFLEYFLRKFDIL